MAIRVAFPNRNARNKMPLLFYFPLIIWMGMLGAMQDELRMPVTAKMPAKSALS